jgi:hypothetical protein
MSVALATRLDMLKKPATAEISQMSRSENPARRRASQLDREIQHRPLPFGQPRGAVIHRDQFAQDWIAGILPDRGAMRHQAIEAAIIRRYRDRDHLAFELAQA